jgi:hypothetical protein
LKSTAKLSITNMPLNVVRREPINVSVATNAAITPTSDRGMVSHFRRSDRNASNSSTSMIVPERISSGRIAW